MDVPGLSIFQNGGESIHINTDANRLEEEEAIEDQKRRNEELGNQLQNAFDDLIDDDEYTVDSSALFHSKLSNGGGDAQKMLYREPSNNLFDNKKFHELCINIPATVNNNDEEVEKLKKIVQSKDKELENIAKLVHDERKKSDELTKRLALSEAEKSRAQMNKQQTHELLVESKAKCSELEDSKTKLKEKIKYLEDTNTQMTSDLERTRNILSDVQHKYHMIEKNAGYSADRHAEILIKQANDRNAGQIEMMQQQIDNLRNKLDSKEMEVKTLDARYKELQRSREALLLDKSETINQLAKTLDESQRQCQQLMNKQDYSQENIKLQRLVNALETQTEDMQKTINNLTARLESTTAELELMDSVLQENDPGSDISLKRISLSNANLIGSTPLTTNDRLAKLKNELYRCMSSQKLKRDEIRKLQDILNTKNDEIKKLKNDENKSLVQLTTYKEQIERLENRVKNLITELDEIKIKNIGGDLEGNLKTEIERLTEINNSLQIKLEEMENENKILIAEKQDELLSENNERKRIDSEMKNLNIDLEELKQEHDSLKKNYEILVNENEQLKRRQSYDPLRLELEKQKFLLKESQNECDRLKNLYVDITRAKDTISIELAQLKCSDLYKEMHEERQKTVNLERALQIAEMKCAEVMKILEIEKTSREQELEMLRKKNEKEKVESASKNSSTNCSKCIDYMSEVSKIEIKNLQLENQSSLHLRQISDLQLQLNESQEIIKELNEKLTLKCDQDKIIASLKEKAEEFENYIKSQNNSPSQNLFGTASTSGISSPKHHNACGQSCETSPEQKLKLESKIRDEMARIFAIEIKNNEDSFKEQHRLIELQNSMLKSDLQRINFDLKQRHNEVQILKHAIISEREKMNEILKTKEENVEELVQQQTNILQKCRDDLNERQGRISDLIKELEDRNAQIEAERQSMKAVMSQWESQQSYKDKSNTDWQTIIDELKSDHQKITESLKLKYDSAKKTAYNYKRYAEEKEQHMLQEYERIKAEYALTKTKLEKRYHEFIERKTREMKDEIISIRLQYDLKLKNLQGCN